MNGDTISYIGEETLKKLKDYEMNKQVAASPVLNRIDEIEKMLNKCITYLDVAKERFDMKGFISEKQLAVLSKMSKAIDDGYVEDRPVVSSESDKELIKKCLAQSPNSTFVKSIAEFYNKNGRITDKQRDALIRNSTAAVNGNVNKNIDTNSVEYKDTQAFLIKCEEAYPESNFVKSVKEQFIRNGKITDKQRNALVKTLKEAEDKIKAVEIVETVSEVKDEDKIDIGGE